MKAVCGFAFLCVSLAAMSGCASMEPRQQAALQAEAMTAEQAYIARVEQIARRRGIGVTWVNLPRFRKETAVAQE